MRITKGTLLRYMGQAGDYKVQKVTAECVFVTTEQNEEIAIPRREVDLGVYKVVEVEKPKADRVRGKGKKVK